MGKQQTQNSQHFSTEGEEQRGPMAPNLKTPSKVTVVETVPSRWQNWQTEQRNRVESSEIDPGNRATWPSGQRSTGNRWDKDHLFNSGSYNPGCPHAGMNADTDITPFTKLTSKWLVGLKGKCRTMKPLGDDIGENLDDLVYDDLLDTPPSTWAMKDIIGQLGLTEVDQFCSVRDNVKRTIRWATNGRGKAAKNTADKKRSVI